MVQGKPGLRQYWWVALCVFAVFGYTIGKDMALRDNARDSAEASRVS